MAGDGGYVRRMLGGRSQGGLKAVVISFVDGLAQWNSRVLKRPNMIGVVHQNDRPLRESQQLASECSLEANTGRRVVNRLFEHKRRAVHHPDRAERDEKKNDR